VTPNTLAIVDDEAVVHKVLLPRRDTRMGFRLFVLFTKGCVNGIQVVVRLNRS